MLAGAVDKPSLVAREVVGDARPLAQLDDLGCRRVQEPERLAVAAQGTGQGASVAAVVLGAGRREAVAEAVELLRIDGVNREAALHHGFHHGSMACTSVPVVARSQSAISARPEPLCWKPRSPSTSPAASKRHT